MPAYKLDPEWVMSYLELQEQQLSSEVHPKDKEVIMNKIREMTLSIMYKQARRFLVYLEADETEAERTKKKKTHLM
ncbi:hypothetical protein ABER61_21520 [Brevibacillus formosus]|uniref:Uncharacterized protein n=1 Tax=Brevibacillus formosus TaxID=54913 RepID=A0A837KHA8_9BACL|nr:hypothetical protein [Brevibacillus formosus]KLH97137.1 hypothetical protein AA984_21480 [Brevibacillus formosus]MED1957796.1 hypothetical protein [Brevibacillus formosus]PSJ93978.1 hypothetical protein C7R91_18325 [Brevibacillus formosus]GED58894.1 hypothetical protein BFO01nite_30260 [Brevibacillus formosus]